MSLQWVRPVAKWTGLCLAGLVGLVVLVYLVLLVVYWSDEPPSEAVLVYADLLGDRGDLRSEDNAVIYLAGIGAARDSEPREAGLRWLALQDMSLYARVEQREQGGPELFARFPMREHLKETETLNVIPRLNEACGLVDRDCVALIKANREALEQALIQLDWFIQRYETLLAHEDWHEPVHKPYYVTGVSGLEYAVRLSRLRGLQALLMTHEGQAGQALALLEEEARFWRRVLVHGETLSIASFSRVFLANNLRWTNAVLREADHGSVDVPSVWQQPITAEERSMQRGVAGGLEVLHNQLNWDPHPDWSLLDIIQSWLQSPLMQEQALVNAVAGAYTDVSEQLRLPYTELEAAYESFHARSPRVSYPSGWREFIPAAQTEYLVLFLRNHFFDQGLSVADLEGPRRTLVLSAGLRAEGVAAEEVPEHLEASEIRNPYTEQPFGWDPELRAIIFEKLDAQWKAPYWTSERENTWVLPY